MNRKSSRGTLAFVVPTLNETAAQNEDIVQILLFAAAKLAQALADNSDLSVAATILSVERDTRG